MILSLDLHRAIVKLWDDFSISDSFTDHWSAGDTDEYIALADTEARPQTPLPFCVYELTEVDVDHRSSGLDGDSRVREMHQFDLSFHVYAQQVAGQSAKSLAGELAEAIIAKYGGHPTIAKEEMTLTDGGIPLVQFENDFGVPVGDEEHHWLINYRILADFPMAG